MVLTGSLTLSSYDEHLPITQRVSGRNQSIPY